jgi:hypothetical protein
LANRGLSVGVILMAALAAGATTRGVRAQDGPEARPLPTAAELATARQWFAQGLKAEDQSQWAEALKLFDRVVKVAASPVVHYHVGFCNEQLGHVV